MISLAEVYAEPCQTSKIERFSKIINRFDRILHTSRFIIVT